MELPTTNEINKLIEKRNKYLDCLRWLNEIVETLRCSAHLSENRIFKKHPVLYYWWFTVTIGIHRLTTQIKINRTVLDVKRGKT